MPEIDGKLAKFLRKILLFAIFSIKISAVFKI